MTEKVLLLGNGIAREYYKGAGWNEVLDKLRNLGHYTLPSGKYQMPMPLKAEMFAKNNLNEFLELLNIDLPHDKQHNSFGELLSLNFHHILTTNYTYEAECALLNAPEIELSRINRIHNLTGNNYFNNNQEYSDNKTEHHRVEIDNLQKYEDLITTYNAIGNKKIWHIHGEAAYPHSIVLGYSAYAQLLHSYMKKIETPENSWLDAFVNGDVYILGFGMDFAEIDLWWLLKYKSDHRKNAKTIFFNPLPTNISSCKVCEQANCEGSEKWCKLKMLEIYGVQIENINFEIEYDNNSKEPKFRNFYEKSLQSIERDI